MQLKKLFHWRRDRLAELLEEAEELASDELQKKEIHAQFFKLMADFFQASRNRTQSQFDKSLSKNNLNEAFIIYLNRLLSLLKEVRQIIGSMLESDQKIVSNSEELKSGEL